MRKRLLTDLDRRADGLYLLLGLPVVQSLLFQIQSEVRDLLLQLSYKGIPAPEQSIIITTLNHVSKQSRVWQC